MIRKSASWALKPLQAPPPPEHPPPEFPSPFPASGDGVVVPPARPRVSPGNRGFPRALPGVGVFAAPPFPPVEGRGERLLSGGEGLLSRGDWATIVRRLGLSMREAQIICLIVTEQKDHAIALEIGISYNTLRTQLSRLYRKLGVQTRVGVVVRAYEALIELRQTPAENTQRQERQQPEEERS